MKKMAFVLAMMACVCLPVFSQADPLDAAIDEVYANLLKHTQLNNWERGYIIAVDKIDGAPPALSDYIVEQLSAKIKKDGHFRLLDRSIERDMAAWDAATYMNRAFIHCEIRFSRAANVWKFESRIGGSSYSSTIKRNIEAKGTILTLVPEINPNAEKDPFLDIGAAFSYYPPGVLNPFEGIAGPDMDMTYNYNISLSMGLKLFKSVNTFVDFNMKDTAMEKAINIAGKIGAKKFGIQIDYQSAGGGFSMPDWYSDYWYPPENTLPDKWEQTMLTIGLMSPVWDLYGAEIRGGFIWNSFTTPSSYEVVYENAKNRVYVDSNKFNMYGIRVTMDAGNLYGGVPFLGDNWSFIADLVFDLSFGKTGPSDEIAEDAKKYNVTADDFLVTGVRGRLLAGLAYGIPFSMKREIRFGFGVDINLLMFTIGDEAKSGNVLIPEIPDNNAIGFFARVRVKI